MGDYNFNRQNYPSQYPRTYQPDMNSAPRKNQGGKGPDMWQNLLVIVIIAIILILTVTLVVVLQLRNNSSSGFTSTDNMPVHNRPAAITSDLTTVDNISILKNGEPVDTTALEAVSKVKSIEKSVTFIELESFANVMGYGYEKTQTGAILTTADQKSMSFTRGTPSVIYTNGEFTELLDILENPFEREGKLYVHVRDFQLFLNADVVYDHESQAVVISINE